MEIGGLSENLPSQGMGKVRMIKSENSKTFISKTGYYGYVNSIGLSFGQTYVVFDG